MASLAVHVRFVLLLPLLAAAGCKVVLDVPTGGSVVSQSGEYQCGEQDICEIDVEDVNFDETFVAQPREAYEFVGWKERTGGLCSKADVRTAPCPVSTGPLALVPELLGLLDADISVYLEPEFAVKPQVTIVYPPDNANHIDGSVLIRGSASSPEGVAIVRVNGVRAFLRAVAIEPGVDFPTEASFDVFVNIAPGTTTVGVEMTDGSGASSTDSVSVNYRQFPEDFMLDMQNNRVLSLVRSDFFRWDLVAFDLETGERTGLAENLDSSESYQCLKADTQEVFRVSIVSNNQVTLKSFDLASGVDSLIASTLLEPPFGASTDSLRLESLACESGGDTAYLTYSFLAPGTFTPVLGTRITAFDLTTGDSELTAVVPNGGGIGVPLAGAKIYGEELVGWRYGGFTDVDNPLEVIDRNTGDVRFAGGHRATILDVVGDKATDTFYLINGDGVYSLRDLEDESIGVSVDTGTDPQNFSNPDSAALDSEGNRLIVGDAEVKSVFSIDLSNGNREVLLSQATGQGPQILQASQMLVTADGKTAYVLDGPQNDPIKLLEIDLATGDRRAVGDFSDYGDAALSGLALDEAAGVIYSALGDTIVSTNLASGRSRVVAGAFSGLGPLFSEASDIALDKSNNRLLIADAGLEAVIAMDLDSRERSLFSRENSHGAGPALTGVSELVVDPDSGVAYTASREMEGMIAVDLGTGDRERLFTTCQDLAGATGPAQFTNLADIDFGNGRILISDFSLKAFDLESGTCSQIGSPRTPLSAISDIEGSDGLVYATSDFFRALTLVDISSGNLVLISD